MNKRGFAPAPQTARASLLSRNVHVIAAVELITIVYLWSLIVPLVLGAIALQTSALISFTLGFTTYLIIGGKLLQQIPL
jgi:hypothetical protein